MRVDEVVGLVNTPNKIGEHFNTHLRFYTNL